MYRQEDYIENVFGINVRPRKKETKVDRNLFDHPIIHRQINGNQIYVSRLWK
ncbi:hypothetical protein ACFYKX_15630 [Cytobacillus sp. FJAT-54145]|uniref:Uncharacterized protein n=1 Tax=Cytobacillus spartinae TaxID=3299023 RepID=A0ABW6KCY7_9BACI